MKQKLYRLQSRAGLSLASTAAGAAGEDSELRNEQTFCHTSMGVRDDRQGYVERTHTMNATFTGRPLLCLKIRRSLCGRGHLARR